jgi:uncharacterized LabA/DUF88 family protein
MARDGKKLALFIDGANLHSTAKSLGFDIDYKRLLSEFQSRGSLVRAFYSDLVELQSKVCRVERVGVQHVVRAR